MRRNISLQSCLLPSRQLCNHLPALFGSVDDIVLKRTGKGGEECAVARNANDQRLIVFGMCLCVQQRVLGDYVVLYVHALLIKEGAQIRHKLFKSAHAGKCRGMELLVKQRAVGGCCVVEAGYRVCSCGGAEHVSAGRRAYAVCNGGVGKSAVRRCAGLVAQRYVCGYGVQTSLILTAAGILIFVQGFGVGLLILNIFNF